MNITKIATVGHTGISIIIVDIFPGFSIDCANGWKMMSGMPWFRMQVMLNGSEFARIAKYSTGGAA